MTDSDVKRREDRLIQGSRYMKCPNCKAVRDILQYKPMDIPEEYQTELNPVYKCPRNLNGCSFIFSPTDETVLEALEALRQLGN